MTSCKDVCNVICFTILAALGVFFLFVVPLFFGIIINNTEADRKPTTCTLIDVAPKECHSVGSGPGSFIDCFYMVTLSFNSTSLCIGDDKNNTQINSIRSGYVWLEDWRPGSQHICTVDTISCNIVADIGISRAAAIGLSVFSAIIGVLLLIVPVSLFIDWIKNKFADIRKYRHHLETENGAIETQL